MTADGVHAPDVQPKAKIFISYSRKDMAFADRLEAALKARGFEPLIDRTEIYAFEDWWKRIEALIIRADTVVFVLSPDAVASDVALKEVAYAASLNKRFAPIVYRRVDDKQVPEALAKLNFISSTTQRSSSAAQINWPRRSGQILAGSGSTPSLVSRRADGLRHRSRAACCCARPCWSRQSGGSRRGLLVHLRLPRRPNVLSEEADRARRGGGTFSLAAWPPGWCSRLCSPAWLIGSVA
jgi:hypothetical protein